MQAALPVVLVVACGMAAPALAFDAGTARCVGFGKALADAAGMLGVLGDHDARHAEETALAAALDRSRNGAALDDQRAAVDAARAEFKPVALAFYRKQATVPGTAVDPAAAVQAMQTECAPLLAP
ncbi:MAG TPA: hypothetical protein VLA78_10655 [Paracoccaceae bacterium]|nr:hypothetical protein [Paracoccaceae bacterium]